MILEILNHEYQYEAEKLTRIFYPNEKINVVFEKTRNDDEAVLSTSIENETARVAFYDCGGNILFSECESLGNVQDRELVIVTLIFSALTEITGYTPKWGMLTGIRPSKLLRNLKEQTSAEEGKRILRQRYFVSDDKTELADSVARAEEKIISLSHPDSFSLYVSVPFCPTRCSYCSFVSHAMTAELINKLMPDYVEYLVREIKYTAQIAKNLNLRLESVYYGGGTPTTLSEKQLGTVIAAIADSFDLSSVREYTIEAGRPDTVTAEKLSVMKQGGVSRISINPQTFSDEILNNIGRHHTAKQTEEAFLLAREAGFDNINMDLIAGLPGDTLEGFKKTVDKALSFTPENITVHTLALKRSSNMGEGGKVAVEKSRLAGDMLDFAYDSMLDNGYYPYYMYRQAKSLGNLENTGYCKNGRECLYNIFMMEECHSVFAVGAGAVTRLKAPNSSKIDRIFNYKYPYEYINGFEVLLDRKNSIYKFYENDRRESLCLI